MHAVGALERMEANIGQVLSTNAECITTIHCLKVSEGVAPRLYHSTASCQPHASVASPPADLTSHRHLLILYGMQGVAAALRASSCTQHLLHVQIRGIACKNGCCRGSTGAHASRVSCCWKAGTNQAACHLDVVVS